MEKLKRIINLVCQITAPIFLFFGWYAFFYKFSFLTIPLYFLISIISISVMPAGRYRFVLKIIWIISISLLVILSILLCLFFLALRIEKNNNF